MAAQPPNTPPLCIWCRRPTSSNEPVEHIVPHAIGCPEDFILTNGEVCAACNNGMGHLDQALVQDIEVYAALAGVPNKAGRTSRISGFGNMRADIEGDGLVYRFNMERHPVEIRPGVMLAGYRGKPRDVDAEMRVENGQAEIVFGLEFGVSPKVARALVKLGAEYVCWTLGREIAADAIQGAVADFVLRGNGYRPVVLFAGDKDKYEHVFGTILQTEKGHYCCIFRLAHMHVMVDLTPDVSAFPAFAEALYKDHGRECWTTLPPDAVATRGSELIVRRC